MKIVQIIRCAFGQHERDRSTVVSDSTWHRARCVGCRAPMVKRSTGWELDRQDAA
ncbi:hypothetical protein [Sphingomonas sp. LT1P40]|uniref:hypothetical protein n=1 Tax=Alteristakelama amylovorans TaxID=3096166 RepID=UPI002FCA2C1A